MTLLDTEQSYVESLRTLMQVRGHGWGAGGHVVRQGDIGSCHSAAVPSLWPSLPCGHPFLVALPGMWSQTPVLYEHGNGEETGGSVGDSNRSTP